MKTLFRKENLKIVLKFLGDNWFKVAIILTMLYCSNQISNGMNIEIKSIGQNSNIDEQLLIHSMSDIERAINKLSREVANISIAINLH